MPFRKVVPQGEYSGECVDERDGYGVAPLRSGEDIVILGDTDGRAFIVPKVAAELLCVATQKYAPTVRRCNETTVVSVFRGFDEDNRTQWEDLLSDRFSFTLGKYNCGAFFGSWRFAFNERDKTWWVPVPYPPLPEKEAPVATDCV